jgi:signal transduction histidine kinase
MVYSAWLSLARHARKPSERLESRLLLTANQDNGRGINQRDMPYIFDRFYRADASRNSATGGSGIGLSIVKKIIEDHGGKIWATSKEGDGTTMFFVIRKYQETQDMNRQ